MPPRLDGDLELGADAIRGGDQQRVAEAGGLRVEEGAETAEQRRRSSAGSGFGQRLDGFDQRVACIDIDAGITVALTLNGILARYSGVPGSRRRPY
jgi:hypothetical protein